MPHSRLNFIDPRGGVGLQSGSPQGQGPPQDKVSL